MNLSTQPKILQNFQISSKRNDRNDDNKLRISLGRTVSSKDVSWCYFPLETWNKKRTTLLIIAVTVPGATTLRRRDASLRRAERDPLMHTDGVDAFPLDVFRQLILS